MINFMMEITSLRQELSTLHISELRKIASTQYDLELNLPVSRQEIIEEILGEEYRIACK
jgi:hypothetical protein